MIDKSLFNAVADMFVLLIQAQSRQLLFKCQRITFLCNNSSHSHRLTASERPSGVLKKKKEKKTHGGQQMTIMIITQLHLEQLVDSLLKMSAVTFCPLIQSTTAGTM